MANKSKSNKQAKGRGNAPLQPQPASAKNEAVKVFGYLPDDNPPIGAMLSLGFQQFLTMFPATVLVAILTKFDVGITLLASGTWHHRCPAGLEAQDPHVLRLIVLLYRGGHHGHEQVRARLL